MMKYIILMLMICLGKISHSQDYPRYEINANGLKVIVMTIDQAQKLDNNSDLLEVFKKLNSNIDSINIINLKVIDDKNNVISLLELKISKIGESNRLNYESMIYLQKQIDIYKNNEIILNKMIVNKEGVISQKDVDIKLIKKRSRFIIGSQSIVILTMIYYIIVH